MCAGALLAARVARVAFGAPDPKAGSLGSLYNLGADPCPPTSSRRAPACAAEECGELLRSFFVDRRDAL